MLPGRRLLPILPPPSVRRDDEERIMAFRAMLLAGVLAVTGAAANLTETARRQALEYTYATRRLVD